MIRTPRKKKRKSHKRKKGFSRKLGRPKKGGRRSPIGKKVDLMNANAEALHAAYTLNDLDHAFTLKRRSEEAFEDALKLCGGTKYRGHTDCDLIGPAIGRVRTAAREFNRCKCPK